MREEFWDLMCAAVGLWRIALAILLVMLVLTLASLAVVTPGSAAYYVSVFNVLIAVPLLAVTVYVLRKCGQRRGDA